MELDELTPTHFEPLVGERFTVTGAGDAGAGEAVALELVAVERLPPHSLRAEPFSVSFRGPRTAPLPQQILPLEHPALGRFELFLVPVAGDATTLTYQAIFN